MVLILFITWSLFMITFAFFEAGKLSVLWARFSALVFLSISVVYYIPTHSAIEIFKVASVPFGVFYLINFVGNFFDGRGVD